MTTSSTTSSTAYGLTYWAALALQTRRYGHCYVHSGARDAAEFAFRAHQTADGITFSYTGWGRSLAGGGHKYKVHACYADGRPVPTKVLRSL